MTTRTDIHSPSNMKPEDYKYVVDTYFGLSEELTKAFAESQRIYADIQEKHGVTFHENGGCAHCGAHHIWGAIYKHIPTGEYLSVGWQCAANRFSLDDNAEWARKNQAKIAQQVRNYGKNQEAARKFLDANPDLIPALDREESTEDHPTLSNLRSKLWKYGFLSEKQVAFARKLYFEIIPETKARKAAAERQFPGIVGLLEKADKEYNDLTYDKNGYYDDGWDMNKREFDRRRNLGILSDMFYKINKFGLSSKQIDFAVKLLAQVGYIEPTTEMKEAEAARETLPTGKAIEVEGTIKSARYDDTWDRMQALVVTEKGWKVWGTVPSSITSETGWTAEDLKGIKVRFVANIEPSKDDEYFGFFKRPRKAGVVS